MICDAKTTVDTIYHKMFSADLVGDDAALRSHLPQRLSI